MISGKGRTGSRAGMTQLHPPSSLALHQPPNFFHTWTECTLRVGVGRTIPKARTAAGTLSVLSVWWMVVGIGRAAVALLCGCRMSARGWGQGSRCFKCSLRQSLPLTDGALTEGNRSLPSLISSTLIPYAHQGHVLLRANGP